MPEPSTLGAAMLALGKELMPSLLGAALAFEKVERGEMSLPEYIWAWISTNIFRYIFAVSCGYYIGRGLIQYLSLVEFVSYAVMFSISLFSYRVWDALKAVLPVFFKQLAIAVPNSISNVTGAYRDSYDQYKDEQYTETQIDDELEKLNEKDNH